MKHHVHKLLEPHTIAFKMTTEAEEGVNEPESLLCLHLIRVYREALTNVAKHSKAMKVSVSLHKAAAG
jgi:signal transduction histidine kinase